jgi:hypothetical protein
VENIRMGDGGNGRIGEKKEIENNFKGDTIILK